MSSFQAANKGLVDLSTLIEQRFTSALGSIRHELSRWLSSEDRLTLFRLVLNVLRSSPWLGPRPWLGRDR